MTNKLYLNNEVSKILKLAPRTVLSWTEKGLVIPAKPALKAGISRGYDYLNLIEFGLAKYLLNTLNVQFYMALSILKETKETGLLKVWIEGPKLSENSGTLIYFFFRREALHYKMFPYIDPHYFYESYKIKARVDRVENRVAFIYGADPKTALEKTNCLENKDIPLNECQGLILVNLGQIKQEIDKGISQVK